MTSSLCILGETVDRLRASRRAGVPVSQLVAELRGQGMDLETVNRYFREAFLVSGRANVAMLPKTEAGEADPHILDSYVAEQIEETREKWQSAPPYPDLMRRRDRIVFEQVARQYDIVLIVCAADRAAAQNIGKAGGPGYRIHGAYRREGGSNAWTSGQGEQIRAELNRRLGADLVQGGPHDIWAGRLELPEGHPLRGPQPPTLFFLPDGDVQVRSDAKSMELYYRFLGIDWDGLYSSTLAREANE